MAGRICDQLKARYGDASVYMDIDNIPLGTDFRDHIHTALDQADVLIVVVGPKWLGARRNGSNRIMDDYDPVRTEVEVALKRGIAVVPVLVDGAAMPDAADLPESIKSFRFRNAASVDAGIDFHQQVERLARSVDRIIGEERPVARLLQRLDWVRSMPRAPLIVAFAIAALSAMTVWWTIGAAGRLGISHPGRSEWDVEKSSVYLEPTGDKRQFFFVKPSDELGARGAKSGSRLFDGRKTDNMSYEGKLFVFAGRCGTREYDASGPITNDDQTVTLSGMAPRIDPDSCLKIDEQARTLVFNFKRVTN